MEVARRGMVAYGKLFSKRAGLVSWEWYDRSPEESRAKIVQHLGMLCPDAFDDDLMKLI